MCAQSSLASAGRFTLSPSVRGGVGASIVAATLALAACGPAPAPTFGRVPAFTLTTDRGEALRGSDLRGGVYVVNFIFTRCASICPDLTRAMKEVQDAFESRGFRDARLVSISVDPEYDTPERLREYAARFGARPERWSFLTGDPAAVRALVVEGFRVPLDEPQIPNAGAPIDIAHTGKFVLVDREGAIRGYFDSDDEGLEALVRAAGRL